MRKQERSIQREFVCWTDKSFVHNYSIERVRPAWVMTHPIIAFIVYMVLLALNITAAFYDPFILPLGILNTITGVFILADIALAGRRSDRFFRKLENRNTEPNLHVKGFRIGRFSFLFCVIGFFCFTVVAFYEIMSNETEKTNLFSVQWLFIFANMNFSYSANVTACSFVFLNNDEGMLFGGALFRYETLSGFTPTGEGNGFVLNYGGKEVARGNMLLYDQNRLQEMLESRDRAE